MPYRDSRGISSGQAAKFEGLIVNKASASEVLAS
jgi:hypothetical protein